MKEIQKKVLAFAVLVMTGAVFAAGNASVTTNGTEVTVTVESGGDYESSEVYGSDITKIIKTGVGFFTYVPTERASYGDVEIQGGQFRVRNVLGLGTGSIYVGVAGGLMAKCSSAYPSLTIPNKVIFEQGGSSYVAAFDGVDAPTLTLTSVGTPAEATTHEIKMGRAGSGYSVERLSLTGSDSEAISQICLQGKTDFEIDGGTIKARADALSPFIRDMNGGSESAPKTCTVSARGCTIDVAEGGSVAFGMPIGFTGYTNTLEMVSPSNHNFENGETGWTYDNSGNTQQGKVGIKENNDSTWAQGVYDAHGGRKFMGLRWGHSIKSSPVEIQTSSDDWFVTFDVACRPGQQGQKAPIVVTVDVDTENAQSMTIPARPASHQDFRRFVVGPFSIAAGNHTIKIQTQDGANGGYQELFFDWINFERMELGLSRPRTGAIVKTGAGSLLGESEFARDATLEVRNGLLALKNAACSALWLTVSGGESRLALPVLTDASKIVVDDGGIMSLSVPTLSADSTIAVAAGGTLVLADDIGDECIVNGSFEDDGEKLDASPCNPQGWAMSKIEETTLNVNGSGLQGNGGNVSPVSDGPVTTHGSVTAYLRELSKLSQTVKGLSAGRYRLSFELSCRVKLYSSRMPLTVAVDGEAVVSIPGTSSAYPFTKHETIVELTEGDHVLSFASGIPEGISREGLGQGSMLFVDDVHLEKVTPIVAIEDGEIRLSSGATLQLDNASKVTIKNLFVDDVRISGGRKALEAAGVTVTGSGAIRVGDPLGLMTILK